MNLDAILIQVKDIIGIAKTLRKIWPTWRCSSKNSFSSFSQLADTPLMKKILVIEDDTELRVLIEMFLSYDNFHVVMACDGIEGLEALTNSSFDLVITDFRMPRMNGGEFAKIAIERFPNLPIILSSAFVPKLGVELETKLHFLPKPYQMIEMIVKINNLLKIQSRIDLAL